MAKKQLSAEQKKLDVDLWIVTIVTLGVFLFVCGNERAADGFC